MPAKFFPATTDLLERTIPEDITVKTEYLGELSTLKLLTPVFTALLVADAERKNFKDSPSGCLDWATEATNLERGYLRHLIRIGRVLLSVDKPVFDIMKYLNFRKLLDILTLPKNDIPKFILSYGKELIKMTDDGVREKVYEVRGKELISSSTKSDKYQPDLWESLDALAENDEADFQALAMNEKFNEASARKFAIGSLGMLTACKTYWQAHGSDVEILAAVEKQLRDDADALAEIRNGQAARLQAG